MFSFEYFKTLLKEAYAGGDADMSYEDAEAIFRYYFAAFELTFHKPHKNLRFDTVRNLIKRLSYCEQDGSRMFDLDLESYEAIIDQHFKTQYQNCDYGICHFMSGDVRANRYYETCY